MDTVYYFPRWKAIIIGIICILIGLTYLLINIMFNKVNNITDIFNSILPEIRHGITNFVFEILLIIISLTLITNGIKFIIEPKRITLLQFTDKEILYQIKNMNRQQTKLHFWGTSNLIRINYTDIISIKIRSNNLAKIFEIKTKDGRIHDLPFVFSVKDEDAITEYIRKKIN
jgi:hypothetical protein